MENSPPKKRVSKHFTVEDKQKVLNIFKTFQEEPSTSKIVSVEMTAKAAGMTERSVYNIVKEYNTNHELQPPKKYHRKRAVLDMVDDEMKNAIRRIVHSFFFKNEPPTVQKVLTVINERDDIPNFKITTLRSLLKELNFRTQTLRTFLILLAGIKLTRLTKPHRNFSDNDTDYVDNYATILTRTYQYGDHDFANGGQNVTSTKEYPHLHATRHGEQRPHEKNGHLYLTDGSESISKHWETPKDTLATESRIIRSGNVSSRHVGDKNRSETGTAAGNGNLNGQRTEANQKAIDDAVRDGLKELHDLYFVKEPLLYKMGLYLDPKEPASRVAAFSEPDPRALLHAKYGFATVQASLKLAQRYPNNLGRQNFGEILKSNLLNEQCPLRGIPRCALPSKRYRTADGTCNNIEEPWRGSAMTPMQRFLPPVYEDGVLTPRRSIFNRNLPSSRKISTTIHRDKNRSTPTITLMFMQWGQFLDHDITLTATARAFNNSIPRCCLPGSTGFLPPELTHPECMPIAVPRDDWFLSRFGTRCMEFIRSAPATRINCDLGWREQINQVTSYIDGSMIYGSDVRRAESLRTFEGGTLQYGRRGFNKSPPDPPDGEICRNGAISTSCFAGGDSRFGEQPALTAMHTIWLRFHNKIARGLQDLNPLWSDEKLYQETRRIIGALIQHVTYNEFLPILLGQEVIELFELRLVSKDYYTGYDSKVNPTTENTFATAAFRFGHSLVQNSFVRSTINHNQLLNNVSIHNEQNNLDNIWSQGSLDRLILGLCNQPSQMRDEFIGDELTNHLFQSGNVPFGMDLAAINIQRGRDHGLPPYTSWRQPCGLSPVNSWQDLSRVMRVETVERLQSLYIHVDDIDLYSGGLAEKPVRGGMVGPVFACIIAQQFLNNRKGDRFWYENGNFKSSFTPPQLQQIRKVNFAHVLCETIGEVHNIQRFVFLASDDDQNLRMTCSDLVGNSLHLGSWAEESFDVNSIDSNGDFNLEAVEQKEDNLFFNNISQNPQNLFETIKNSDDFNFEKGFQETLSALNLINAQNQIIIDDKLETINIDDFRKKTLKNLNSVSKRETQNLHKERLEQNKGNLILIRNLKNIKMNEYIDKQLEKSPNISSEITVLTKSNHPLNQKVINDTIVLLRSNKYSHNSSTLLKTKTDSSTIKINDFMDDFHATNEVFEDQNNHTINTTDNRTDLKLHTKQNDTVNKLNVMQRQNEDDVLDDEKSRDIDDYILDTLSDLYYDDDEDYNSQSTANKNKRKKRPTNRPKQTKRKPTSRPTLSLITKEPDKSNTLTSTLTDESNVEIYEDSEGTEFMIIHDNDEHVHDNYEDIGPETYTNSKYPNDIKKVHYADDDFNDPIMSGDFTENNDESPNYQVNINIHLHPTMKPTQIMDVLTKRPTRPNYDVDKHLIQLSLIHNNKTVSGNPTKTNQYKNRIDTSNGHKFTQALTTKRPSSSYPIYIINNDRNVPNHKVTYVTGYMIEEPSTKPTNMHVIPIYRPNADSTNKRPTNKLTTRDIDENYSYLHKEHTTKAPYRPIIVVRPHDVSETNIEDGYDVPVHKLPFYLTSVPAKTTKRTTYGPQTTKPIFPSYLYNYNGEEKDDDLQGNFETVHYVKRPIKLTSTSDSFYQKIHHIDDKLDFKTNLLPYQLKPPDKNYVKISSVKVGYGNTKQNELENKAEADDHVDDNDEIFLPELEGLKVVQIDVLPSENRYKSTAPPNNTGDIFSIPRFSKLYPNEDCALEVPKPITTTNTMTPPTA